MKNLILITYLVSFVALLFGSCGEAKSNSENNNEVQKIKEMKKTENIPQDLVELLSELNYWVSMGGDPDHPKNNLKSTGESHSKFLDLKEEILKSEFDLKWKVDKYILIKSE